MALYHTSMKIIGRAQGVSAVAAAAYRAGTAMRDTRTDSTHDYTKRGGVLGVHLRAPTNAPQWALDPQSLWVHAESVEVRRNARTARELIFCLPHELSESQRAKLALAVTDVVVRRYTVAAMVAIHAPDARGDQRNFHAHLLMTTREMGPQGLGKKVTALDHRKTGPEEVTWLRQQVADLTNDALAAAGIEERVDHRTLAAQAGEAEAAGDFDKAARLTRMPTKHQGRAATAAHRRGEFVPVVAENQRRRRDHEDALAAYLRKAHSEGRLMPAAHDLRPSACSQSALPASPAPRSLPTLPWKPDARVRATGPGAAALNAQAALQADQRRRSKKAADDYLRGLEATAREGKRWLDEYAELAGHRHALEMWLTSTEDAEALRLMQKSIETLRELREADTARRVVVRQSANAERARRAHQRALDQHDSKKPSRWTLIQRRKWEQARRAKWASLRKAIMEEQQVATSSHDTTVHRDRIRALRDDLRRFEQGLRERRATMQAPQPPEAQVQPGHQAVRRPRHPQP